MAQSLPKLARIISALALLSFACCLCAISASARPGRLSLGHDCGPLRQLNVSTVVNLSDYGATGDGLTDDSPALQHALDELANSGGGTLMVPAGNYRLATPVLEQFAPGTSLTIAGVPSSTPINVAGNGRGLNLTSEFMIAVGQANNAISLVGLESLLINDMSFVGVPTVIDDARIVLALFEIKQATVHHCEFYGLASLVAGGAIVSSEHTDLRLEESAFLGCATNSGISTSVVQNTSWLGVSVTDCKFVDYGDRPGFFSKTPLQSPYSWIGVGNAADLEPTSSRREAIFENVFLDEGGYFAITAIPTSSAPPYEIYMSRLFVNVNNLFSDGVYIHQAQKVFIDRSHFGWSHQAGFAITLSNVGDAVLDLIDCQDDATRIRATAQRLTVINSVYTVLDSTGPVTRVINTDTPEEDAAQYVRQEYVSALQHDPDPAGHFYWTDKILRCEADTDCVSQAQVTLATFLNANPAAKFSISGQIVDEDGLPLAAVVTLTGSQSTAMETDESGNFAFANLATAGDYVVTPTKNHYTFESQTFITPPTNQATRFAGTLLRYTISGRVIASNGRDLAGALLTLSGSQLETTTSDSDGNFVFSNLAGGGNYTVNVSRANYTFDSASRSFNDLSNNEDFSFVGTVLKYAIAGHVTKVDGAALAAAAITLSGGASASATTDANGNYSFTVNAEDNYTVSIFRQNYTFSPSSRSFASLSENRSADFTGTPVNFVISGRVVTPDGLNFNGVTISVTGSQTGSVLTDSNGNYSFTLPAEGNYTITPQIINYGFSPLSTTVNTLSANQLANFTAGLNPGVPVLMTAADPTRALALDSVLRTPEPFDLSYDSAWAAGHRTRLMLFATHFELLPGEGADDVTATVEDAQGRIYPLRVEYAGAVEGLNWLISIVVRLGPDLSDVGDVKVRITYRGATSEPKLIGIGHIGRDDSVKALSGKTGQVNTTAQ